MREREREREREGERESQRVRKIYILKIESKLETKRKKIKAREIIIRENRKAKIILHLPYIYPIISVIPSFITIS